MKNRRKSRAGRKAKQFTRTPEECEYRPWLNSEGYSDPTAYIALRSIERAERKKRGKQDR